MKSIYEKCWNLPKGHCRTNALMLAPRAVLVLQGWALSRVGRQTVLRLPSPKSCEKGSSAQSWPVGNGEDRRVPDPFLVLRHLWRNCRESLRGIQRLELAEGKSIESFVRTEKLSEAVGHNMLFNSCFCTFCVNT